MPSILPPPPDIKGFIPTLPGNKSANIVKVRNMALLAAIKYSKVNTENKLMTFEVINIAGHFEKYLLNGIRDTMTLDERYK